MRINWKKSNRPVSQKFIFCHNFFLPPSFTLYRSLCLSFVLSVPELLGRTWNLPETSSLHLKPWGCFRWVSCGEFKLHGESRFIRRPPWWNKAPQRPYSSSTATGRCPSPPSLAMTGGGGGVVKGGEVWLENCWSEMIEMTSFVVIFVWGGN